MTDWICFIVAFGIVVPWLLAGACLLAEWACKAVTHCWRMRTDAIYREVEIRFRADLVEAGLDSRAILMWSAVVAMGYLLARDVGWLLSMRWLWSMSAPLIALQLAAILVAAACLHLTVVSFVQLLRAHRDSAARRDSDDRGDWDDLLRAAEELSAQYDTITDGDRRRTAALANSLHGGFGGECGRETVRLVQRDHDEP